MGSVDEDEMIMFQSQAADWWNPNGPAGGLHVLSAFIVPHIQKCAGSNTSTPLKNLSILDAGCGAGIMSEALAKLGWEVTGLDPCEGMITAAKEHAEGFPNLNYVLAEIEAFAEKNEGKFDVVVSCDVLEHVTKYEQYLEACVKCLKKGGSIIVVTFNRTFVAWIGTIVLAEYVMRVVPVGTHHWNKFIALKDTKRVLKNYGCETKSVVGMMANVLTGNWYFTRCKSMEYAIHSIKK